MLRWLKQKKHFWRYEKTLFDIKPWHLVYGTFTQRVKSF